PGWGETLFLGQVWPEARQFHYCEFFYRPKGLDVGFDPELSVQTLPNSMWVAARSAPQLLALSHAEKFLSPTQWQASTFATFIRNRITVIHDGIDTEGVRPFAEATVHIPKLGRPLRRGDEVVTFVSRNLEPYRGYHIFMRALPRLLAERKDAQVVILGGDSF